MYNERREGYSLTDVLLQIAFIVLFVFLLVWLFPTKNFVQQQVQLVDDSSFNQNIMTMKEAAKEYFTLERLPQKQGDKVKITLGELLGKKLILPFSDEASKSCDLTKSYVEVVKMKNEYEMKINLNCGEKEDYLISIMGCYDYCQTTLCVKQETPIKKPTPKPVVSKIYEYEYKLTTGGSWGPWSNWSNWSLDRQTTGTSKEERTKTETVFSHYETINTGKIVRDKLIGRQSFLSKQTTTNTTEYVYVGTRQETVTTGTITVGTGTYVRDQFLGTTKYTSRQTTNTSREYANERISYERTSSSPYATNTYTSRQTNTNSVDYVNERISYVRTSSSPYATNTYTSRQTSTNSVDYANERISYVRTSSSPYATNTYTSRQTSTNSVDYANERISYVRTSSSPYATNTYTSRQTSTNSVDYANERISYVRTSSTPSSRQTYTTKKSNTNTTDYVLVGTSYSRGSYIGRYEYNSTKANTSTRQYVYVTTRSEMSCTDACRVVNIYVYDVYYRNTNYTYDLYTKAARYTYDLYAKAARYTYDLYAKAARYTYDLYAKAARYTYDLYAKAARYTYDVYSLKETTKTENVTKIVTYYIYDVYSRKAEIKQNAVYKDVTYYSYRTREYKGGTVSIKWSRSKTDKNLLQQGYKLTGKTRVVR